MLEPETQWELKRINISDTEEKLPEAGHVRFETGFLTPEEISQILNAIPGDMTFIDKNDTVKYFSQGKERIFARTKAVIGRSVQDCHPPTSVNVVEKILEDFKAGRKDSEDFWIKI